MTTDRSPRRTFARHFGEMLLAMLLGMAVLGGIAEGIAALAGTSVSDAPVAARAGLMGFNMTLPMVAWMRYRGHDWARSTEMAGAMVVPTLAAVAAYWAGVIPSDAVSGLQHGVMIPAMLGVMLWRRDHYTHQHRARTARRPVPA